MSLDKRTRKILKTIYRSPYITVAEIKEMYPANDTADILSWLDQEKYISFRVAGSASEDLGYETHPTNEEAHLISIRKGRIEAEDLSLFRANVALCIAALSLVLSICAFIFR